MLSLRSPSPSGKTNEETQCQVTPQCTQLERSWRSPSPFSSLWQDSLPRQSHLGRGSSQRMGRLGPARSVGGKTPRAVLSAAEDGDAESIVVFSPPRCYGKGTSGSNTPGRTLNGGDARLPASAAPTRGEEGTGWRLLCHHQPREWKCSAPSASPRKFCSSSCLIAVF